MTLNMKMLQNLSPNAKVLNGFLSFLVLALIAGLIAIVAIMILWAVGVF